MRKGGSVVLSMILVGILCVGCMKQSPPPPPQPVYLYHTITYPGETLGIISGWYTGDASLWRVIAEQNPDLDVRRLKIGAVVRIPQELVTREDALPRSRVARIQENVVRENEASADQSEARDQGAEEQELVPEQGAKADTSVDRDSALSTESPSKGSLSEATDGVTVGEEGEQDLSSEEDLASSPKRIPEKVEVRKRSREDLLREILEE